MKSSMMSNHGFLSSPGSTLLTTTSRRSAYVASHLVDLPVHLLLTLGLSVAVVLVVGAEHHRTVLMPFLPGPNGRVRFVEILTNPCILVTRARRVRRIINIE
jgi:hypothetical protein